MSNMSTCQHSLRLKASRPRHSSSVRLRSRVASMASCGKRLSQNGGFFQGTKRGMTLKDGLNFCCKRVLRFCEGQMFVLESCFQVVGIWDWVNYSSWYNAHEFTSRQRAAPAAFNDFTAFWSSLLWYPALRASLLQLDMLASLAVLPRSNGHYTHAQSLAQWFSQWIFTNQFAPQFLPIHVHKIEFPKSFRLSHSLTSKRCCAVRGVPCRVLLWGPSL